MEDSTHRQLANASLIGNGIVPDTRVVYRIGPLIYLLVAGIQIELDGRNR